MSNTNTTTTGLMTFDISDQDLTILLTSLDLDILATLNPEDFEGFGMMNSHVYRKKFFDIAKAANLSKDALMMVIVLATVVKNKKRILAAVKKFAAAPWYSSVTQFYSQKICQYTYEATATTFAVVHIPSCVPFMAARAWLHVTKNPSKDTFLANLWASQIRLSQTLMDEQKAWETNFWAQTVKKGGSKFEAKGFNETYWVTKSADNYPLLLKDGTVLAPSNGVNYEEADLITFFASK